MTSAQRLVDADWAMEILALANAKMKCSATTHAIAVQVLAESGRLGEASALLKVKVFFRCVTIIFVPRAMVMLFPFKVEIFSGANFEA